MNIFSRNIKMNKGHSYIYRPDGSLDDQVILSWPVSDGGTKATYNPNLTARDLTLLRHIIWILHDIYHGRGPEDEILRKIIHPLMFRNIKFDEIFNDLQQKNP